MAAYGAQPFSIKIFYNGEAAIPAHTPIMVMESLDNDVFQICGDKRYSYGDPNNSIPIKESDFRLLVTLDSVSNLVVDDYQWISVVNYGKATVMQPPQNVTMKVNPKGVLDDVVYNMTIRTGYDTYVNWPGSNTNKQPCWIKIGKSLGLNQVWLSGMRGSNINIIDTEFFSLPLQDLFESDTIHDPKFLRNQEKSLGARLPSSNKPSIPDFSNKLQSDNIQSNEQLRRRIEQNRDREKTIQSAQKRYQIGGTPLRVATNDPGDLSKLSKSPQKRYQISGTPLRVATNDPGDLSKLSKTPQQDDIFYSLSPATGINKSKTSKISTPARRYLDEQIQNAERAVEEMELRNSKIKLDLSEQNTGIKKVPAIPTESKQNEDTESQDATLFPSSPKDPVQHLLQKTDELQNINGGYRWKGDLPDIKNGTIDDYEDFIASNQPVWAVMQRMRGKNKIHPIKLFENLKEFLDAGGDALGVFTIKNEKLIFMSVVALKEAPNETHETGKDYLYEKINSSP